MPTGTRSALHFILSASSMGPTSTTQSTGLAWRFVNSCDAACRREIVDCAFGMEPFAGIHNEHFG